jgi:hypothetical protein
MKLLIISIIEAIYIIYVLNFLKTRYSIAHPLSFFNNTYLYHPIGYSEEPRSNICRFGKDVSWFLAGYLIIRAILLENNLFKKKIVLEFNRFIILFTFIVSLINFNAVLYLLPIFILEYMLFFN